MATWDPTRYLHFADERSRPFVELVDRVDVKARRIADLGCGPGHLTALLRARWPEAAIEGVDSSPEMIERAAAGNSDPDVSYTQADLRDWTAGPPPLDLIVSNAAFQWVPDHLEILPRLADQVAPGGGFAFSVPGNFDAPSHRLLDELAATEPFADHTRDRARPTAHDAATYLGLFAGSGWQVDAWETTYLHVLTGADPVYTWISGTGARPVLQALPDELRPVFVRRFKAALRDAYPAREWGTILPFRRIFVVARRPA